MLFSGSLREYKMGTLATNGLKKRDKYLKVTRNTLKQYLQFDDKINTK